MDAAMSRATGIKSTRRTGRVNVTVVTQGRKGFRGHGLCKSLSNKTEVQFALGREVGGSSILFCGKCPEMDLSPIDLDLGSELPRGLACRTDPQKSGCGVISLRLGAVLVVDRVGSQAQIDPAVVGAITIDVINKSLRPLASHKQPCKPVRKDGFPKDSNPRVPLGFIHAATLASIPAGQPPKFAQQRGVANVGGSILVRHGGRTPATDYNSGPTTTTGGVLGVHNWSLEPVGLVRSHHNLAHVDGYPKGNAKDGKGEDAECGLHGSGLSSCDGLKHVQAKAACNVMLKRGALGLLPPWQKLDGIACDQLGDIESHVVQPHKAINHAVVGRVQDFMALSAKALGFSIEGGEVEFGKASHRAGDVDAHTSALHLGGLALGLGQLGPDAQPRSLAKVLPSQNTTRLGFKAHCLCRIHVLPPRQALIEVLLMNAMRGCQLAANFGFDHSAHVSHHSDSLDGLQAIRYKSLSGDLIEPKTMETSSDRRKRKLAQLCADKGGLRAVADKSGVSWESLDQVLKGTLLPPKKDGSRSPRSLGSAAARAIESAFGLGAGWFDLADEAAPTSQSFASLSAYEAALITVIRNGLSEKELSQLTDAVQGAVKTKRVRESTGSDVGEIGVYFSLDRRSHDVKVDSDQRGVPWEIKHSGQSPPDSKGSKRGAS